MAIRGHVQSFGRRAVLGAIVAAAATSAMGPSGMPASASPAAWGVAPSPNVGTGLNGLADVTAPSDRVTWAVGSYFDTRAQAGRTLALRGTADGWAVVPTPNVGTGWRALVAVDSAGRRSVWAVGSFSPVRFGTEQSLILQWTGRGWQQAAAPEQLNWDGLSDVSVISGDEAWAVGNAYLGSFVLRWDGVAWTEVDAPNVGWLAAVHAVGPDDVWAVGQAAPSRGASGTIYGTLAMHWDGNAWSVVDTPSMDADFNTLSGVAGRSSDDVWAVGGWWQSTQPTNTLALHWDGSAWELVPGPDTGPDSELFDVISLPAGTAEAVGSAGDATLIERWDGSAWSVVPAPSPGSNDVLAGITALRSGERWAVGSTTPSDVGRTLVLFEPG